MKEEYIKLKKLAKSAADYAYDIDYEFGQVKEKFNVGAIISEKALCSDEITNCKKKIKELMDDLSYIQSACNNTIKKLNEIEESARLSEETKNEEELVGDKDDTSSSNSSNKSTSKMPNKSKKGISVVSLRD